MQTDCKHVMPECVLLLNGVCYPKSEYVNLRANNFGESSHRGGKHSNLSLSEGID